MLTDIVNMGPMGMLNTLILIILAVIACVNFWRLYLSKKTPDLNKVGRSINNMLFWGVIIVILGLIGTFLGMQTVIDSIAQAGTGDIRVILGGVRLLFPLLIYSFNSFLIISLVWYIFTGQHRKLLERSMKQQYASE